MLLKEMNHDPNEYQTLLSDTVSLTSSPTKPLNFLNKDLNVHHPHQLTQAQDLITSILSLSKENNSSSDTYTSDTEGATHQGDTLKKSSGVSTQEEDFLFVTPMTSATDLLQNKTGAKQSLKSSQSTLMATNESLQPTHQDNQGPTSIMKKTSVNSPKKVLFTDNTPEVHLYPQEISASEEERSISFNSSPEYTSAGVVHEWNDLEIAKENELSPPIALSQFANSYTELLKENISNDDEESDVIELTKSQLTKHNSQSDLTLTEKMSYFLENQNQDEEDLDTHLEKLNDAFSNKTLHNILSLSKDIQTHKNTNSESMLDSLAKVGNESELRSSGSSQSSLASLAQSNRQLPLQPSGNSVQGIKLNNGVKGVTDDFIDQLAPKTDSPRALGSNEFTQRNASTSPRRAILSTETSSSDEFHDSFDQSYVQTEQSIMNLLNSSAKNTPIPKNVAKFGDAPADGLQEKTGLVERQIKYETPSLLDLPLPDIDEPSTSSIADSNALGPQFALQLQLQPNLYQEPHIKAEPVETTFEGNELDIKKEPTEGSLASYIDQTDGASFDDSEGGAKVESVSGYGRHSDSREVKLVKTPPASSAELSPTNDIDNINDESVADESSLKFSIRFQMDSDWKLESSHDGDKEDNTEFTNNDISQARSVSGAHSTLRGDLLDDAEAQESEVTPGHDNNDEVGISQSKEISNEAMLEPPFSTKTGSETVEISDELQIIALANSSNVAPPDEFTLPEIEPNLHTSFDEISKSLQVDSYEESLSAEHDMANKKTDFRDIWHSQRQKNKRESVHKKPNSAIPVSQSTYFSSVNSSLPTPLKANRKIFKEVNVTARRVVSPGFEDLQVSGFLPELSEDSGFANKFQFNSSEQPDTERHIPEDVKRSHSKHPRIKIHSMASVNTSNILDSVDNNPNVLEPPQPRRNVSRGNFKVNYASAPQEHLVESKVTFQQSANSKPSRFRVPTFEIKRTKSALSPIDKYNNDIFSDVLGKRDTSLHEKPTIMGSGMKTLPSMDRDDVKRILSTKRLISQDEYRDMKLSHMKKDTMITMQNGQKFDDLQQHASIYNMSSEDDHGEAQDHTDGLLPSHIASELLKTPTELQEKDGFFGAEQKSKLILPWVDPSTTKVTASSSGPALGQVPPRPKRSAIKISLSPTKNYEGERFPEFIVDEPEQTTKSEEDTKDSQEPFSGNEITNTKLRNQRVSSYNRTPPLDMSEFGASVDNVVADDQQRQISTVSVPTIESKETTQSVVNHTAASPPLTTVAQEYRKNKGIQEQQISSGSSSPEEESGRLFFKVIGLKGIQLPDIGEHNGSLSVTLDNGVHCIKTPQYPVKTNSVLIGKEFELVVGRSLQFILTMKMSYHHPKDRLVEVKETKKVKSKNRISRVFGKKDTVTETKVVAKKISDSWEDAFAQDGSFGRCYVDLSQYEQKISGKALSFDLTCFNEWATYLAGGRKSKKKPYKIGQLEVKMLYIPKTQKSEAMPTSIGHAYRSIEQLQHESQVEIDGYMNQEGGDCEVWKRRFFKLRGTALIAHSEISHKSRSKINLSKVVDVVYMDKENTGEGQPHGNNPRRNVRNFTDGLFFENAFQIRFANGEVITFGATNESEKHAWVSAIERIIYDNQFRRLPWVRLMLERNLPDMF